MKPLIMICARKGSKRLPDKAIKPFYGKPLIQWTIEQADHFSKNKYPIVICTDIKLPQQVYNLKYGSQVLTIGRSKEVSGDGVPKLATIRYALRKTEEFTQKEYGCVIDLDVTNPARKPNDIASAYGIFESGRFDNVFSVTHARKSPYFNQVQYHFGAFLSAGRKMDDLCNLNGLPAVFDMNASILILKRQWLLDERNDHPVCLGSGMYLMGDWQFVDIDTELDFKLAEFLFVGNMFKDRE